MNKVWSGKRVRTTYGQASIVGTVVHQEGSNLLIRVDESSRSSDVKAGQSILVHSANVSEFVGEGVLKN